MEQPVASKYSSQRAPGKEHIPLFPKGFVAIRIIQLVVAIICLGLSAFGIAFLVFAGDCLTLFTSIATLLTSIYILVAHFGPPKAYNYWAILGLDIFLVLFWLISFAILAAQVASAFAAYSEYSDYYDDYYDLSAYDAAITTYGACLAAAAGLGGLEFLLYIISLTIHGIMLHRHRKSGLKAMPLATTHHPTTAPAAPGELQGDGGAKFQMVQQPQHQQPQPQPQPAAGAWNTAHPPAPAGSQVAGSGGNGGGGFYPPHSPSPISPQPTGGAYAQPQPQQYPQQQGAANPGHQPIYEAPGHAQQYPSA